MRPRKSAPRISLRNSMSGVFFSASIVLSPRRVYRFASPVPSFPFQLIRPVLHASDVLVVLRSFVPYTVPNDTTHWRTYEADTYYYA